MIAMCYVSVFSASFAKPGEPEDSAEYIIGYDPKTLETKHIVTVRSANLDDGLARTFDPLQWGAS